MKRVGMAIGMAVMSARLVRLLVMIWSARVSAASDTRWSGPRMGHDKTRPNWSERWWPWRPLWGPDALLAQRDASGEQEWMDLPGRDPNEMARMFADLRRVNQMLGGRGITLRGLSQMVEQMPEAREIRLLDVASGSVDIPRMAARWAKNQGRRISIVATDNNAEVLELARVHGDLDSITLVAADALNLPFPDRSFDIAACSFFLHHLEPESVVKALREMRRVSTEGVLINDMLRGWPSYLGALLLSRTFTRNPISRHDAPLSARRSYTRAELTELAGRAGLDVVDSYGFFGYRAVLVTVAQNEQAANPARVKLVPAMAN